MAINEEGYQELSYEGSSSVVQCFPLFAYLQVINSSKLITLSNSIKQ